MREWLFDHIEAITSIFLLLLASIFHAGREYGRFRNDGITPGKVQIAISMLGAFLLGFAAYKGVSAYTGDPGGWGICAGLLCCLAGERFLKNLALEIVHGVFKKRD